MNTGVVPQRAWDGRAAANFMAGGAGSGLVVATACGATLLGSARWPFVLAAVIVAIGLASVWAEIGRPWRALNVFLHARSSWMTREALLAPVLLLLALAAALLPGVAAVAAPLAALSALAFVYCQGRMLRAARGIPTWREPAIVPLIVATALVEGAALWLIVISRPVGALAWLVFGALLLARQGLWLRWRSRLHAAPPAALRAVDEAGRVLRLGSLGALALVVVLLLAPLPPIGAAPLQLLAALAALAGGLWFKYTLITRGGFTQGFSIPHRPVRGARRQEP